MTKRFLGYSKDDVIFLLCFSSICLVGAAAILGGPAVFYFRTQTTMQALNQQCGTNYNWIQVATAGENLSRLCQVKNQTLTIKGGGK